MGRATKPAPHRAIERAVGEGSSGVSKLAALDELQHSLALTKKKAFAWAKRVRVERASASARREQ